MIIGPQSSFTDGNYRLALDAGAGFCFLIDFYGAHRSRRRMWTTSFVKNNVVSAVFADDLLLTDDGGLDELSTK
jgi:hypothetical protein